MSTTVFTQLSETDLQALIMKVLVSFHEQRSTTVVPPLPEIGGIEMAMEITGLKRPTIYGLTSSREIPHYRQGKRLYFKRAELLTWIESGRKPTTSEIAAAPGKLPRRNAKRGRRP